jgi:hypothetical protein
MRAQIAVVSILAATAGAAGAQTRVVNEPPPIPQDVTVVAPKNVKVTGSYPADGASIPGGMVVIRISFDQPMSADAWSYTKSDRGAFPNCLSEPRLLPDKRSFVLLCSLPLNTAYAFDVNATPTFETVGGRKPAPYKISFRTSGDINIGMHAALDAAGLQDADNPIMNESSTPDVVRSPAGPIAATASPSSR